MDGTFWVAMGLVGLPVGMFLWAGTFDWLEVHRMRKGYARSEPAPTLENTTERLRALHRRYRREAFEEWDAEFARLDPAAPAPAEEQYPRAWDSTVMRTWDGGVISVPVYYTAAASPQPPKGGSGVSRPKAGPTVVELHRELQVAQEELKKRNRELKAREAIARHIAQHGISAARLLHQIEEER